VSRQQVALLGGDRQLAELNAEHLPGSGGLRASGQRRARVGAADNEAQPDQVASLSLRPVVLMSVTAAAARLRDRRRGARHAVPFPRKRGAWSCHCP
jgi:hypothetical protein